MASNELIKVGQDKECNFKTITEALEAVEDNGKIFVTGGVYKEVIHINKQVELTGDPDNIPIIKSKSGLVCSVNSKSVISNIHFKNTSTVKINKDRKNGINEITHEGPEGLVSVLEINADCICNNCEISNAVNSNVKAIGPDIKVHFNNCTIHGANRNGIYFINCSEAKVTKSEIFDNGNNGIAINNSNYLVEDCDIYNGTGEAYGTSSGIFIGGETEGSLINNDIREIIGCGITFCLKAKPSVKKCNIYDIKKDDDSLGFGIYLCEACEGSFSECKIYDIEGIGISIRDDCSSVIDNCEIYSCDDHNYSNVSDGIRIYDSSKVTIKNCTLYDIEGTCVYVNDNAEPVIENCDIDDFFEYSDEDDCLADMYLAMSSGDCF